MDDPRTEPEACAGCDGHGFIIARAGLDGIERCDQCMRYATDADALHALTAAADMLDELRAIIRPVRAGLPACWDLTPAIVRSAEAVVRRAMGE